MLSDLTIVSYHEKKPKLILSVATILLRGWLLFSGSINQQNFSSVPWLCWPEVITHPAMRITVSCLETVEGNQLK